MTIFTENRRYGGYAGKNGAMSGLSLFTGHRLRLGNVE